MRFTLQENCLRFITWLLKPFNWATFRRWLDILLLGVIGSTVCFLLWPLLTKISEGTSWLLDFIWLHISNTLGIGGIAFGMWPWQQAIIISSLTILLSLGCAPLIRLGALRWGSTFSFLLYPPTWFAAVWPFLIVYWLIPSTIIIELSSYRISLLVLLISCILALSATSLFSGNGIANRLKSLIWPWRRRSSNSEHLPTSEETLQRLANNPQDLIDWIMSDDPVEEPWQDLFESHRHAQHIAELITGKRLGRIGLIGSLGAGKTSVLNLTEYLLHKSKSFAIDYYRRWRKDGEKPLRPPPRILTCHVGAWGFIKEPAANVVLRKAIVELSNHVDCLAVHSLPEEYLGTLKGIAPSWLHVPLALLSANNPMEQLKRLDPLLEAINARLVIFIEDLDRNTEMPDVTINQNFNHNGDNISSEVSNNVAAIPNGRIFLEVESLLDRMSEVERVSFVLALGRRPA